MHLLNTTTKQLESFDDEDDIPRYAILSHTWGKEEVLFNHIAGSDDARREGKRRKGYAKIIGSCKQAKEDGWEYIWIDTCCINKESSAELSEAINSMYKWYQQAEACYVYLEDVYSGMHNQKASLKTSKWMGATKRIALPKWMKEDNTIEIDGNGEEDNSIEMVPFERSKWFTRGWTLQELLAPQYVVFYSRDWVDIGTRASLQEVISATTRIRVEMLVAFDPKKASVAERMSWAAYRETTRKEDIAYCLMGLFGVNMPLLYGEGRRAFRRLQEEIMKVSDDHSLFAWKGPYSDYATPDDCIARGMLADTPREFCDGANIEPSDVAYSAYSMTNQGLQIQLPLQPIDPKCDLLEINPNYRKDIFKVTLKCTIREKQPTRWIVVYLKMIRKGYYQRVFAHWLDATEIDPNESKLTSLVVPQIDTPTTNDTQKSQGIMMKMLPTQSRFTADGHSLVNGYEDPDYKYKEDEFIKATVFDGPQGECFAVVIGFKDHLVWLDVVDVITEWGHPQKRKELKDNIKQAYEEGGCRYDKVLQHLDRLSVKISDWSVVVWTKLSNRNSRDFSVTVDIQRELILSRGWYTSSDPTSTSDSFSGDLPLKGYLNGDYVVHPDFKKERGDWIAIFNPKAERILDISPVHSITCHSPPNSISTRGITFVQFSPDGNLLAVRYSESMLQIYDVNTGELRTLFGGESTIEDVSSVCFSPDGKFLAIGTDSKEIVVWDMEKAQGGNHKILDNDQYLHSTSLCFSLDSRLIISGSDHGTIQIWDIADETPQLQTLTLDWELFIQSVAISPNGRLVAGSCGSTVYIWDLATKQLVKKLKGYDRVVFTPDGERLVIGGPDGLGSLGVEELTPAQLKATIMMDGSNSAGPVDGPRFSDMSTQREAGLQMISKSWGVKSVAVSSDGHWLISGLIDGSVQFWNLEEGTPQFLLWGHMSNIESVDMSPVGNIFTTSSMDSRRIRIWRYDTMKLKEREEGYNDIDMEKSMKKEGNMDNYLYSLPNFDWQKWSSLSHGLSEFDEIGDEV